MSARNFTASVKEYANGHLWIVFETDGDVGLSAKQHVTLEFQPGTTYEQAREVQDFLNSRVHQVRVVRY